MQRTLTITISDDVYRGLHERIGRGEISHFTEHLIRPPVVGDDDGRMAGCSITLLRLDDALKNAPPMR